MDIVCEWYNDKITKYCDGVDPYKYKLISLKDPLPITVDHGEIYNYLVLGQSFDTKEAFKAYKSLDSYKWYLSGWVQNVLL